MQCGLASALLAAGASRCTGWLLALPSLQLYASPSEKCEIKATRAATNVHGLRPSACQPCCSYLPPSSPDFLQTSSAHPPSPSAHAMGNYGVALLHGHRLGLQCPLLPPRDPMHVIAWSGGLCPCFLISSLPTTLSNDAPPRFRKRSFLCETILFWRRWRRTRVAGRGDGRSMSSLKDAGSESLQT